MKTRIHFLVSASLIILSLLYSCNTSKGVTWAYDPNQDFNTYKTFNLVTKNHGLDKIKNLNTKYAEATIKHDVTHELVKKGLTTQMTEPDLVIDFVLVVKESDTYSVDSESKARNDKLLWNIPKRRRYSTPGSSGATTEKDYAMRDDKSEEGTLIILIKDHKTDQVVWQGKCSEAFLPEEDFSSELTPAIKKILKHFPVSK